MSESCICDLSYSRSWCPILCWHLRLHILVYNQKRKWLSLKSSANIDSTVLTNTHTSCTYGINFKIIRHLALKLLHSQEFQKTWPMTFSSKSQRLKPVPHLVDTPMASVWNSYVAFFLNYSQDLQKTWLLTFDLEVKVPRIQTHLRFLDVSNWFSS